MWSESENQDMALSFQFEASCQEIWDDICHIQGTGSCVEITHDFLEESLEQYPEVLETSTMVDLPNCELDKLQQISDLITSVLTSPILKERLALALENKDYIKSLLHLFHICEDRKDTKGLGHLHEIIKGIMYLNKTTLFEIMLSDKYIMDVVGCLEYDPSLDQPKNHREFLTQNVKFKEVIPKTDCALKRKIHQTYRMQYIHDILSPTSPVFEDNFISTLKTFIFYNKVEIICLLQDDDVFLSGIFTQLMDKTTDCNKLCEMVLFVKEFCSFSQTLQPHNKDRLFKTLTQLKILPALKSVMSVNDVQIRSASADIFGFLVEYSPCMIRRFVLEDAQQSKGSDLFINLVIDQIIRDTDPELGGAIQLTGLLRTLLDPENMQITPSRYERNEFQNFFYKHCLHNLIAPLLATTTEDIYEKDNMLEPDKTNDFLNDYQTAQLLGVILEFLTFCVQHHTYYIRNYILSKDLLRRVLILMNSKHTFLILDAVRFMRRMIGIKDELYNCYIIQGNFFEPIVNTLLSNGARYNMLNSAIIELFEYIRVHNIKSLITHVIEKFYKTLGSIEYVQTFKGLKINYEQEKDRQKYIRKNLYTVEYDKIFCRSVKVLEEREEICYTENIEEGMIDNLPLEGDFQDYDKVMEVKKTNKNEKVDLPSRTSSGDFRFASFLSTCPNRSDLVGSVENPEEDENEDEPPPRKRPHLNL